MDATCISILIPVFNEKPFLQKMLDRVLAVDFCGLSPEIVLVDDASTDGTTELIAALQKEHPDWKVMFHAVNQGKGAALQTALKAATGDIIVIQDADLEYDPVDYPPMVQLILDGRADAVYGSRLSAGKAVRAFNVWHYIGNILLTWVTNLLYNTTLSDMETCYKAFRAEVIQGIPLRSKGFDIEPEMTAKILKRHARLYEMPISYYGRDYAEGKKITWVDGIVALWTLVLYRFKD